MTKRQTILPSKQSSQTLDNTSISIACTAIKSGKRQIVTKAFSSRKSLLTDTKSKDTMDTAFTLEMTKREIQQYRLILEPGCIITDTNSTYRCTSITYTDLPRHPILHSKYIGPVTTSF